MTITARPTRWLDDVEMRAWRSFIETFGDVVALLEADLQRDKELTIGDYQVLVYLSEAEGHRLRMSDLAAELHLSPSGLTRRLDGLVRTGLVGREPSADDRRVLLAVLTDAGMERIVDAAPLHVASVRRRLLDALTREQVLQLGDILAAVRAHIEADCPEGGVPGGDSAQDGVLDAAAPGGAVPGGDSAQDGVLDAAAPGGAVPGGDSAQGGVLDAAAPGGGSASG